MRIAAAEKRQVRADDYPILEFDPDPVALIELAAAAALALLPEGEAA